MTFLDVLCELLAFERMRGHEITQIDMSLSYLMSINSLQIPYTEHTSKPQRGLLKAILGIPVNVDTEDRTLWIKYTVSDYPGKTGVIK